MTFYHFLLVTGFWLVIYLLVGFWVTLRVHHSAITTQLKARVLEHIDRHGASKLGRFKPQEVDVVVVGEDLKGLTVELIGTDQGQFKGRVPLHGYPANQVKGYYVYSQTVPIQTKRRGGALEVLYAVVMVLAWPNPKPVMTRFIKWLEGIKA